MEKRSRSQPKSTGKQITPTPRDFALLQALHRHGPLSTEYLYALTRHLGRDFTQCQKRVRDLHHETNTPHAGRYLARPWQLNPPMDFSHKVVSENTTLAERLLVEFDSLGGGASAGGSYPHRFMTACITASFEIALAAHPQLKFIPRSDVDAPLAIPAPISHALGSYDRPIIPDALFGIQYPAGRLYFLVEADLNNEPIRRRDFNTTSYLRKVLQYREAIGSGKYKRALGIDQGLVVLTFTSNRNHAENIRDMVLKEIGPTRYLLFTALPAFDGYFKVPPIIGDILTRPYLRAGHPDFRIDRAA